MRRYWAVWYWSEEANVWRHHTSCDTREDAQDEVRRLKAQGEKTEVRRQDW